MAEKNRRRAELLEALGFKPFDEPIAPDKSHYMTFAIFAVDDFRATFAVDDVGQRWMHEDEAVDLTPYGFLNTADTREH
ncbi:MAG TPA: hypothetical protein VNU25_01390 [Candidatus Paceibacterota bacterium]|nr:hypothetical protein [Candidatus Paceibacterota bacterium]